MIPISKLTHRIIASHGCISVEEINVEFLNAGSIWRSKREEGRLIFGDFMTYCSEAVTSEAETIAEDESPSEADTEKTGSEQSE